MARGVQQEEAAREEWQGAVVRDGGKTVARQQEGHSKGWWQVSGYACTHNRNEAHYVLALNCVGGVLVRAGGGMGTRIYRYLSQSES